MKLRDMPKLPLVLAVAMVVIGAVLYPSLPSRIPVHWGLTGAIDRWAPKSVASVFLPVLITLGLYLLLWLVPYLDPQRANIIKSKQVYAIAIELMSGVMAVVFLTSMLASFRPSFPVASVIQVTTGVMFIVLGNYLGRVKRNWTIGVRYSWTLSDDTVWTRTNRLGGRLFVAAGAIALIGALLPPAWAVAFIVVPVLAIVPITYVYAMRLYRQRHPESMGSPRPPQAGGDAAHMS